MAQRTGSANLPLHGGRVPPWLANRMTRLGTVIRQAIVHHYGRDELLRRLAHPFWFQSFGAVQGMNGENRQARRYHWLSQGLTSFVDAPHAAIEGKGQGEIVNLTDHRAAAS